MSRPPPQTVDSFFSSIVEGDRSMFFRVGNPLDEPSTSYLTVSLRSLRDRSAGQLDRASIEGPPFTLVLSLPCIFLRPVRLRPSDPAGRFHFSIIDSLCFTSVPKLSGTFSLHHASLTFRAAASPSYHTACRARKFEAGHQSRTWCTSCTLLGSQDRRARNLKSHQ